MKRKRKRKLKRNKGKRKGKQDKKGLPKEPKRAKNETVKEGIDVASIWLDVASMWIDRIDMASMWHRWRAKNEKENEQENQMEQW